MLHRRIVAVLTIAILLVPVLSWLPAGQEAAAARKIKFWISNVEGKRFDSRKHSKPFVISFFFVDCVPCRKEIPQLYAMMKANYPGAGLLFVDPLADDSVTYIKEFADQLGVPYSFFYHDPLGSMAKKFFRGQKMVFPTLVGVKDGVEQYRVNDLSQESIAAIQKGLAE